jgi:hypothetical protein
MTSIHNLNNSIDHQINTITTEIIQNTPTAPTHPLINAQSPTTPFLKKKIDIIYPSIKIHPTTQSIEINRSFKGTEPIPPQLLKKIINVLPSINLIKIHPLFKNPKNKPKKYISEEMSPMTAISILL